MANLLQQLMALLQGTPMGRLPRERQGVRPGFGLEEALMIGARPWMDTEDINNMKKGADASGIVRPGFEAEFAKFFGKSILGTAKKPMTLYHGTGADIAAFRPQAGANAGAIGDWPGIYLTPSQKTAGGIANFESQLGRGSARVMPLHARLENPAEFGQYKTIEDAIRAGHDGRVVRDMDGNITEVLVFTPEQIKSATGNRGTYSRTNPDIRE